MSSLHAGFQAVLEVQPRKAATPTVKHAPDAAASADRVFERYASSDMEDVPDAIFGEGEQEVDKEPLKRRTKRRATNIFKAFSDQHYPNMSLSRVEIENGRVRHTIHARKFWQSERDLARWQQSLRDAARYDRFIDDVGARWNPHYHQEQADLLQKHNGASRQPGEFSRQKASSAADLKELQKVIAPYKARAAKKVDKLAATQKGLGVLAGLVRPGEGGAKASKMSEHDEAMATKLVSWLVEKHGSLQKVFQSMDINGNGKLSLNEFASLVYSQRPEIKGWDLKLPMMWSAMDLDMDGVVDSAEFECKLQPLVKKAARERKLARKAERAQQKEWDEMLAASDCTSAPPGPPSSSSRPPSRRPSELVDLGEDQWARYSSKSTPGVQALATVPDDVKARPSSKSTPGVQALATVPDDVKAEPQPDGPVVAFLSPPNSAGRSSPARCPAPQASPEEGQPLPGSGGVDSVQEPADGESMRPSASESPAVDCQPAQPGGVAAGQGGAQGGKPVEAKQELRGAKLPSTISLFIFRNADPMHCGEPVFLRRWPLASLKDVLTAISAQCRPIVGPAEALLTLELTPVRSLEEISAGSALMLKGAEGLDPPPLFLRQRAVLQRRSLGQLTRAKADVSEESFDLFHQTSPLRAQTASSSGSTHSLLMSMSAPQKVGSPLWLSQGDTLATPQKANRWQESTKMSMILSWGV